MRNQFIAAHTREFPVKRMCPVLAVSTSGYYAWRIRPVSTREMANQELLKEIKAAHEASGETYGSPRVYHELIERVPCSQNRVARLMKKYSIQVKQKHCYKRTTKTNDNHPVAPNLLARDFSAAAPNEKWTADITYIPTLEGWLYLAVILDLFSRRVVGWAMSARMTSHLVLDALHMTIQQRRPGPGLLHHSDRGSQYTGADYQQLLKNHHFQVSMSGTGNCYDNAPTESFIGSLKADIFFYMEAFYNRRRRQSILGYVSPVAFEQAYYSNASFILN